MTLQELKQVLSKDVWIEVYYPDEEADPGYGGIGYVYEVEPMKGAEDSEVESVMCGDDDGGPSLIVCMKRKEKEEWEDDGDDGDGDGRGVETDPSDIPLLDSIVFMSRIKKHESGYRKFTVVGKNGGGYDAVVSTECDVIERVGGRYARMWMSDGFKKECAECGGWTAVDEEAGTFSKWILDDGEDACVSCDSRTPGFMRLFVGGDRKFKVLWNGSTFIYCILKRKETSGDGR